MKKLAIFYQRLAYLRRYEIRTTLTDR